MRPIFFTVGKDLPLMIIPDTQAHLDGHTVLTYTYNVYHDHGYENLERVDEKENQLHLTQKDNPDYMGFITFEQPGKLFTYTADGNDDLSPDHVQETIESITHYRDHPGMWQLSGE